MPVRRSPSIPDLTIRPAREADERALAVLAQLDSAPPLAGERLVAESDGRLVAAISLADGRVVADPFVPSADGAALLRVREAQRSLALGWTRGRRRRRRPRPTRPAIAVSQGVA
jgi:hypothetical protein